MMLLDFDAAAAVVVADIGIDVITKYVYSSILKNLYEKSKQNTIHNVRFVYILHILHMHKLWWCCF